MTARFTADEVCRVLGLPQSAATGTFSSVSTDTRSLEPGALFVALQGDRFDGSDFLDEAAARGASAAVVPATRKKLEAGSLPLLAVTNTTAALADLARHYRRRCGARVMGITGSSGKTTVKEMLACALAVERTVHRTEGNLNNQVGVPLSILAASEAAEVWVLEFGSSEPGEIRRLTAIAEPDDAVVTTVGPAHLEGFGDLSGVLDEKLDLIRGAAPAGMAVVGELPEELPAEARRVRDDVVAAGLGPASDFRPEDWSYGPTEARFTHAGTNFAVSVGGEHHLRDAVIAIAAALGAGVSPGAASLGLAGYRPIGMRGALLEIGNVMVVADCYNANPESFEAAIRYCSDAFAGRRLAVVAGTMLELGTAEADAHREVADALLRAGFELVIAVGSFAPAFRELPVPAGVEILFPEDVAEAAELAVERVRPDDVLLVKASRGVRLERVVERLDSVEEGGP